ncbi:hypothetical protein CRG98_032946, partial [Punica granatum]
PGPPRRTLTWCQRHVAAPEPRDASAILSHEFGGSFWKLSPELSILHQKFSLTFTPLSHCRGPPLPSTRGRAARGLQSLRAATREAGIRGPVGPSTSRGGTRSQ